MAKKLNKCFIMGKEYSIATYDKQLDGIVEYPSGISNHSKLMILLDTSLPPDEFADTMLHEILHGYDYHCQLDLTERQVHVVASGLIEFFNNPRNKEITQALLNIK